jgi:hypothetical protein
LLPSERKILAATQSANSVLASGSKDSGTTQQSIQDPTKKTQ